MYAESGLLIASLTARLNFKCSFKIWGNQDANQVKYYSAKKPNTPVLPSYHLPGVIRLNTAG